MKIYKNKDLTEQVERLDLGTVLAGETKQYEFFVYNESPATVVDLQYSVENKEVAIVSFPVNLKPREVGSLILQWTPSVTVKSGLKTSLAIRGSEIWS